MTGAHINSLLPLKNRVLSVDEHTSFLAHYDLNANDVLRGIEPIGREEVLEATADSTIGVIPHQPYFATIGNKMTIEFWLQMTQHHTGYSLNISKQSGNTDSTFNFYMFGNYNGNGAGGNCSFYATRGGVWSTIGAGKTLALNVWHHVAISYDSVAGGQLYLNGTPEGGRAGSGTLGQNTQDIYIKLPKGTSLYNFRIWNRDLSQEEIQKNMQGKSVFSERGLLGSWSLEKEEGNLMRDSSPFHSDFQLTNTEWKRGNSIFTLDRKGGKFGGAIAVEESTVNFAQYTVSGYPNYVTYSREGDDHHFFRHEGSTSGTLTMQCSTFMNGAVEGDVYTISGYLYKNGVPHKTSSPYLSSYHQTTLRRTSRDDGYFEYTQSLSSSVSGWIIHTNISSAVVGDTTTIKNLQIEKKAFATSFTPTSRTNSNLKYSLSSMGISPTGDWTISGWFKRHPGVTNWSALFGMGGYYKEGESEFMIWSNHLSQLKMYSHDNKSGRSQIIIGDLKEGELEDWFFFAATHEQSTDKYSFYVQTKERYAKAERITPHSNPIPDEFYVGGTGSASHVFNGLIDELRVDATVRSEEEIVAWYESNSPFWPRGIYRKSH